MTTPKKPRRIAFRVIIDLPDRMAVRTMQTYVLSAVMNWATYAGVRGVDRKSITVTRILPKRKTIRR